MDPKWRCIPIKIGMFHCYNQRIPKNNGDRIQMPADTRMWHVITRKLPTKTSWIYDSKATKDVVDLQTLGATWIWQYMWLIWKNVYIYIYNFCIHSCQNSGLQWILWKLIKGPYSNGDDDVPVGKRQYIQYIPTPSEGCFSLNINGWRDLCWEKKTR